MKKKNIEERKNKSKTRNETSASCVIKGWRRSVKTQKPWKVFPAVISSRTLPLIRRKDQWSSSTHCDACWCLDRALLYACNRASCSVKKQAKHRSHGLLLTMTASVYVLIENFYTPPTAQTVAWRLKNKRNVNQGIIHSGVGRLIAAKAAQWRLPGPQFPPVIAKPILTTRSIWEPAFLSSTFWSPW